MNQPPHDRFPTAPADILGALNELLRRPTETIARAGRPGRLPVIRLVFGAVLCFTSYGLASGFFQGGSHTLVAAVKAPLIVFGSLLLCVPSLYVVTSLIGIDVSRRWFAVTLCGFTAMLGLLLVALVPISWLFSVSSTSLGFMIFIHVVIWVATLGFALRFLIQATGSRGGFPLFLWSMLFLVVSFQVASQLRPVLWRPDGMALFAPKKVFFLEHLGRIATGEEGPQARTSDDDPSHPPGPGRSP